MARKLTESQQRQVNYTRLRYIGFTKQEATDLVSTRRTLPSGRVIKVALLDLSTPFIKTMMKSRARSWERAKKRGVSRVQFEKRIRERLKKGVTVRHRDGSKKHHDINSVWDLVRVYEDRYTDSHPEYKKTSQPKRPITGEDIKSHKSKRMSEEQNRQREIEYIKSEVLKAEKLIKQETDAIKRQALVENLIKYKQQNKQRYGVDF